MKNAEKKYVMQFKKITIAEFVLIQSLYTNFRETNIVSVIKAYQLWWFGDNLQTEQKMQLPKIIF